MTVNEMLNFRLFGDGGNFGNDIDEIFSQIHSDDILVLFDVDYYIGQNNKAAEFPAFPKYPNYALKTLQEYAETKGILCYCYTRGEPIALPKPESDLLGEKKFILSCLYDNNMKMFLESRYYKVIEDNIIAIGGSNNYISGEYEFKIFVSSGVAFVKFTDGCPNSCSFCCCRTRPFNVRKFTMTENDYKKLKKVSKVVILDENLGCKLFRFDKLIQSILDIKNIKRVEITNGFDYRFVLANDRNKQAFIKLKNSNKLKAMFAYDGRLNKLAEKCYNGGGVSVTVYSLYADMVYKNKFEMCRDLYYNITLKSRPSCHCDPQLRYPALNSEIVTTWMKLFSAGNVVSRYKLSKKIAYKCTGDKIFEDTDEVPVKSFFEDDDDSFSTAFDNTNGSAEADIDFLLSFGIHWTLCVSFLLNQGGLISKQVCDALEITDVEVLDGGLFIENHRYKEHTISNSFARYMLKDMDEVKASIIKLRGQAL